MIEKLEADHSYLDDVKGGHVRRKINEIIDHINKLEAIEVKLDGHQYIAIDDPLKTR